MRVARCWAFTALIVSASPLCAQIVDDFSQGGWRLFDTTPGRIATEAGGLHLEDAKGEPLMVSYVQIERSPFTLVLLSPRGMLQAGWVSLRRDLLGFLAISIVLILAVVFLLATAFVLGFAAPPAARSGRRGDPGFLPQ